MTRPPRSPACASGRFRRAARSASGCGSALGHTGERRTGYGTGTGYRQRGYVYRRQVLVNTSLLLLAGHETTINLLCNGTLAFLRHPEQWARFKRNPAGLAKPATEECLRYDAPVKSI